MERIAKVLAVMACTGVGLCAGAAVAGESKVTIVNAPGAKLDAMKVVKDKETGKIRAATPEEIAEMNAAPSRNFVPNAVVLSRPASTVTVHADGSMTGRRSFDDLDAVVVERGADGKAVLRHAGKAGEAPVSKSAPAKE